MKDSLGELERTLARVGSYGERRFDRQGLADTDPRKAEIVKLLVFTGLQINEIAALLDCSEKPVQRDWNFAKAWISGEMAR